MYVCGYSCYGGAYYIYRKQNYQQTKNRFKKYNGEEISERKLNYYTKPLYKDVANVYGWN